MQPEPKSTKERTYVITVLRAVFIGALSFENFLVLNEQHQMI